MSTKKPNTPPTRAIALKYDGENVPTVVATGQHAVAEQIIARGKSAEIPFVEDPALANALGQLELGDAIPPALFRAVAEVLSYALYVSGKHEEVLRRAQNTRPHDHNPSTSNKADHDT